ncbi:MAG: DUF4097 family beta strand repeat-containing protein [Tissierellia bacterium]|nr:DUF4097 family beta strand repeat-containing protein [Tissierellia bacterium]
MKKSIKIALILIIVGIIFTGFAYAFGAETSVPIGRNKNREKDIEEKIEKIEEDIEKKTDEWEKKIDEKVESEVNPLKEGLFKDTTKAEVSETFENIKEIIIDAPFFDINIDESKRDNIININHDYLMKDNDKIYDLEYKVEGDRLIIEVPKSMKIEYDIKNLANIKYPNLQIDISMPEDLKLSILSDIASLNIKDLDIEKLVVENKVGDINLDDVEIDETKIDCNLGAISFYDCDIDNFQIESTMGSIYASDTEFEQGKMNAKMGAMSFYDCEIKNTEISAVMGSIEFSGEIKEENKIFAKMGSIELKIDQKKANIGILANSSVKNISLNGKEGPYSDERSNFKNFLEVSTEAGSIEIITK